MKIRVDEQRTVSALLEVPERATACLVLAHGAGAGMEHPFMAAVAQGLAARRIASLRFQFPSMEAGSKRPDRPPLAQATVRAAVGAAGRGTKGLPLFAGGKSFGGRMTSQAQAEQPLEGVRGLAFLGFPLHPAGKPSLDRAGHMSAVGIPMLFLQGTRDGLADLSLLEPMVDRLGPSSELRVIEHADHSFHCLIRSGRTDEEALDEALDALADWTGRVLRSQVLPMGDTGDRPWPNLAE